MIMKALKYIFAVAAFAFAVASCQVIGEDAFSKAPVAPELSAHSDIILTANTMAEEVNFSWKKARFIEGESTYRLYAVFGKDTAVLASTTNLYYIAKKSDFKTLIYQKFPSLPVNDTFDMNFFASVAMTSGEIKGPMISLSVYAYGAAVSPVVTPAATQIVLDMSKPNDPVKLLSWEPARLKYNEAVTYSIFLQYGSGALYPFASKIKETSFNSTVDELNEAAIAAGAPEGLKADVKFIVKAVSDTYPEGVPSAAVVISVTTYVATFPEKMYLPGSYKLNNWDPASAPTIPLSTLVKGLYEGVVDLSTADGGNVSFKFAPKPAWEGDFAIGNITIAKFGEGEKYSFIQGNGSTGGNIDAPSGFYNIILNRKFNTLQMVQIEKLSMIGSFAASEGWSKDVDMTYDAATKTFTADEVDLKRDDEFKIRANHDWTHSAGTTNPGENKFSFNQGSNYKFSGDDGKYKVVLDVSKAPYVLKFINLSFPDFVVMAGDYSGHSWSPTNDTKVYHRGSGIYKGPITMYNTTWGFKVVKNGSTWIGGKLQSGSANKFDLGVDDNMKLSDGTYYWIIDLAGMKAEAVPVTKVGLIGGFEGSSWGTDIEMTFDSATLKYSKSLTLKANDEFKFRFNGSWDYNIGGDLSALVHDGGNIKVIEAGTYAIVLDMANTPSCTVTKQ